MSTETVSPVLVQEGHNEAVKGTAVWKAKLGEMAVLYRLEFKSTEEDVAELQSILDRIGSDKERRTRVLSPRAFITCSKPAERQRVYGEFVCMVEDSPNKGKNEVLMLTIASSLSGIKEQLKKAFHLEGDVLILLPEDRLSDEMEQLVLSTRHLQSLLDDFVVRQPARRVLQVIRAMLPITRCLVYGNEDKEGAMVLALNQLFELAQIPGNIEAMDRTECFNELLVAVGSVIGHSPSPVHVAAACRVVWKLAASTDMRQRMVKSGLQDQLWTLTDIIARAVETPNHRKVREKAVAAAAEAEAAAGTTGSSRETTGAREPSIIGAGGAVGSAEQNSTEEREPMDLKAGQALDEIAVNCVGAMSLMLRSELAREQLLGRGCCPSLNAILELATTVMGKDGIGDERVVCMAAEAMAFALISDGSCRVVWVKQGSFVSLLDLLRSPFSRVVLCGASILNAFLRGKPSEVFVSPVEAARVIEEASLVCQHCLDQLGPELLQANGKQAAFRGDTFKMGSRPIHMSKDPNRQENLCILEQATASCWGSLAVIDRCPPGSVEKTVPATCWLPTMLAVAKLAGSKLISPWVIFCAVACIGVGVGVGSNAGKDALAERNTLPWEMLDLLKSTNAMELQEHSARALCSMLSANKRLRRKVLEDAFLDKLQRLLMGCRGSAKLDSTIAYTIMLLCDVHDEDTDGSYTAKPGIGNEETHEITESRESKAVRLNKRSRGTQGVQRGGGTSWTQNNLTSLVWALGHKNQIVLNYTAWTVWLLARRRENRIFLGRLWAIDGLVDALRSNARLSVKEGLLAATWLLACDPDNTTRLAMNGGLQILVGILHFPSSSCYVPLKTLSVGTICKLCRVEPDVATLAMHLSLAPVLLEAVYSQASTVYLKVLAAGLIFTLCKNVEHQDKHAEYLGRFAAEGGPFVLEEMCTELLCSGTSELQACGSFFAASLSLGVRSRYRLLDNGGLKWLCHLARAAATKEPLRLRLLHVLLNFSTEKECQPPICNLILQPLLEFAVSGVPLESEFASSILSNCADNPHCRSIMFEAQLARGSKNVANNRVAREREESVHTALLARHLHNRNRSTPQVVREKFLAWVQEVKRGSTELGGRFDEGEGSFPGLTGHDGLPATEVNRDLRSIQRDLEESKFDLGKRGGAQHPIPNRMAIENGVFKVQHDIRQPVTSLWQTDRERASTAPTRRIPPTVRCCANTTGRDLSRRRPYSQMSVTRASRSATPGVCVVTGGIVGDEVLGAGGGGAVGSANGGSRKNGRHKSRGVEFGDSPATACESEKEMVNRGRPEIKTPVPLRSSHRLGPVGTLGSTPLPGGEYRWKPFISDCYTKPNLLPAWRRKQGGNDVRVTTPRKRRPPTPVSASPTKGERDAMFSQAVKENQTVVVVEPPLNYKMVFDGPTNVDPQRSLTSPTSMALFPHARGASVCAQLYEHYVAKDGLCYHLYHTSRVICEVLDPGGYPPLSEPTELRHVLQKTLPEQPPPDYPSGKPDAKPVLYLPPPTPCPPIESHYVSLCKVACRQTHWGKQCPGTSCKNFGAMPSDFIVFEVGEERKAEEEDVQQDNTPEMDSSKWNIKQSIFAPRRKEAESRAFFDTERVVRKAFDVDYARTLKEERVLKLIAKSDPAVVKGSKTVKESLEEVRKVLTPFYKAFLSIFKFYCLTPSQSVRGAFSIQPNQFGKMMQDANLVGSFISVEEIGKIFVMVNFESNKGSAEADVNEDRALMRFEFIEALLRVAITMRNTSENDDPSPAEKLRTIFEEHLLVNLPPEALEDSDTFRNERLYTEACDNVLQEHQKALATVYQKYSLLDPIAGKPSFGLEEWKTFSNDARLVGDNIHMLRMGLREMKQPFYLSRTIVSDEIKSRMKMTQLTFVDFLEALARLAIAIPIPSDKDMKEAQVTDLLDYELALSSATENSQTHHNNVARATGGALAPRLDKLIRYTLGTLAIRSNGILKAGNKTGMQVVGLYCTKEQLARGIP